jgi:hypothetical protein
MISLRGKSLVAVSRDIADGFVIVNPLFLKPLDAEALKGLYQQIMKTQIETRGRKFPFNDIRAIRVRNMRLQRLHTSLMIIKNFAKDKGMRQLFT